MSEADAGDVRTVLALLLPTTGDARVVHLPRRSELEQLRAIYTLLGCHYVQEVQLAPDVTTWLDEEPMLTPVPPPPNRAAMVLGGAFGRGHLYVGTVVFTGGSNARGDTLDRPASGLQNWPCCSVGSG